MHVTWRLTNERLTPSDVVRSNTVGFRKRVTFVFSREYDRQIFIFAYLACGLVEASFIKYFIFYLSESGTFSRRRDLVSRLNPTTNYTCRHFFVEVASPF